MQIKGMPEGNEATNSQARKGHHSQPKREKAKGISQMIAGAAVAAIGIPLCVLPGPGVAVIACGAALASKGQRTYSGRKPTKVERKLDAAAEKLGSAAKKEAGKIAKTAAREASVVAEKAARAAGKGITAAATAGGKLAAAGGKAVGDAVARKRRERDAGASAGGKAPKNA